MRSSVRNARRSACVLVSALSIVSIAVAAELARNDNHRAANERATSASALVKAALLQSAAGKPAQRAELVSQALSADPNYAAAHWAAGEVNLLGKWTSLDKAPQLALQDVKRVEYLKRRADAGANVPDQMALGQWCRTNGLVDEARAHFSAVVDLQPDNREAIEAMGMKLHNGQWVDARELDATAAAEQQTQQDLRQWQPTLAAIGKRYAVAENREAALEELRAISDPTAISAIDAAIGKANSALAAEMVGVLRRMPQQAATQSLVRLAVLSPSNTTRHAATVALRQRPYHCYVPLLLSGLAMPVQSEVEVVTTGQGVDIRSVTAQEGEVRDQRNIDTAHLSLNVANPQHSFFQQDALARVMQAAEAGQKQIDKTNRKSEKMNQKILRVLKEATGEDFGSQPRIWWNWWHEYSDTYATSSRTTSEYERRYEYRVPYYVPNRYTDASYEPTPSRPTTPRPPRPISHSSCFGKGTPVWSLNGLVAIEEIKAGDRVLSQDPETGELAYRVVLRTTLRPDRPMVTIGAGEDSIASTQGHLFWVSGEGWQMAKELKVGQRLQGPAGSTPIDSIRPASNQAAYNLIVADFGTYFVGQSQVLVHDNTPRKATLAVVPGLVADK